MKRLLRTRAMQKLKRNRQAMAALTVIVVYLAIGLLALGSDVVSMTRRGLGGTGLDPNTLVGMLTLESSEQVVGPAHMPPLGAGERPEKQLDNAGYYLRVYRETLAAAVRSGKRLQQQDPGLMQAEIDAKVVVPALREVRFAEHRIKEGKLSELRAALDHADTLAAELEVSENLDEEPNVEAKLDELDRSVRGLFAPMSTLESMRYWIRTSAGTDRQGRSVMIRGLYSIKVAFQVGLVVATLSVLVGAVVGAAAAYYGSWVDHAVVWVYSTLSSVPDLVLLTVLVFMFTGSIFDDVSRPYLSMIPLYVAMSLTFWIGPCRVVRGETMKIKQLEYVQAATAIGFGRIRILLKHVIPNTVHLMFISFSLLFIAAIKNEVVLSFLGLGVKSGPSWGRMITESGPEVIRQIFWQIGTATVLMFGLVLAFNILSDALQDAFDPKHVD